MLLVTVVPYLALQIFAGIRLRGGWRVAALVPLLWMGPVVVVSVKALLANSNLWPCLLMPVSLASFLYLAIVAISWESHRKSHPELRPQPRGFDVVVPPGEPRGEQQAEDVARRCRGGGPGGPGGPGGLGGSDMS